MDGEPLRLHAPLTHVGQVGMRKSNVQHVPFTQWSQHHRVFLLRTNLLQY